MSTADGADRRALFVHAHPDDESSNTGLTMAKLAAEGVQVTLVTCTLGEEGEVLVPELAELHASRGNNLGPHRLGELTAAMAELGVTDFVRLGGDGHYRDSGMAYDEHGGVIAVDSVSAEAFWNADLTEAANLLVPLIRDRRPQVLITYDQFGNYGHPDHIMAHRVATYAAALAAVPSYRPDLGEAWAVQRFLWSAMSADVMRAGIRSLREAGDTETFAGLDPDGPMPPMAAEAADIAVTVAGERYGIAKVAALRAHASQIDWENSFFARFADQLMGPDSAEVFRFAGGVPVPGGHADDPFAGLELPGTALRSA